MSANEKQQGKEKHKAAKDLFATRIIDAFEYQKVKQPCRLMGRRITQQDSYN